MFISLFHKRRYALPIPRLDLAVFLDANLPALHPEQIGAHKVIKIDHHLRHTTSDAKILNHLQRYAEAKQAQIIFFTRDRKFRSSAKWPTSLSVQLVVIQEYDQEIPEAYHAGHMQTQDLAKVIRQILAILWRQPNQAIA